MARTGIRATNQDLSASEENVRLLKRLHGQARSFAASR